VPRGSTILVAVSGGADSTALLLGLHRLAPEFGYALAAAHLHHGLRDADADEDLALVTRLCQRLGVPLESTRWDTRALMRRRGLSGHDGLRRLRREFLERAAHHAGAATIATGHTAGDQLETLILRLVRGAGLRGMGAMSARRGKWVRPLLDATRDALEADLRSAGLCWREDPSNADPVYRRSRARHEVVPALLRAAGSDPADARARGALERRVARGLAEIRGARRLIERRAAGLLLESRAAGQMKAGSVALDCRRLRPYPLALRQAVLRLAWAECGPGSGLTRAHLEILDRMTFSPHAGRQMDLPAGRVGQRKGHLLHIQPQPAGIEGVRVLGARWIEVPGKGSLGPHRVRAAWLSGAEARNRVAGKSRGDEYFRAGALKGAVELRAGKSDEWFVPFGHQKPRKLADFLRSQGVPEAVRARPVVLADAGGILWVLGVRRSSRAEITSRTKKALWVHSGR